MSEVWMIKGRLRGVWLESIWIVPSFKFSVWMRNGILSLCSSISWVASLSLGEVQHVYYRSLLILNQRGEGQICCNLFLLNFRYTDVWRRIRSPRATEVGDLDFERGIWDSPATLGWKWVFIRYGFCGPLIGCWCCSVVDGDCGEPPRPARRNSKK